MIKKQRRKKLPPHYPPARTTSTTRTFGEAALSYRHKLACEGRLTLDSDRRIETLLDRWMHTKLIEIDTVDIYAYFRAKYSGRRANTMARNMTTFKSVLAHAEDLGWLNHRIRIRHPKGSRDDERIVHLEKNEVMPVIAHVVKHHGILHAFTILLLCDTGVRFGEAMKLRWCDIGPEWVLVRSSATPNSKTKARRIPTSPRLLAFMEHYDLVPSLEDKPHDEILASRWMRHPKRIALETTHALRDAAISTGCVYAMDSLRLHDLRHTFAFLCAQAGADVGDIRDLLGHTNLQMTMRYRGFVACRARDLIRKGMKE